MQEIEQRLRRLMLGGLSGDGAAYRDLLRDLTPRLRAFFRRRLANWPEDCEDLVQETLLAVHARRHTYDADQPFTAWAYAVARYKLVDWHRRHRRREALHDPVEDRIEELFAEVEHEASDARRDVQAMLESLPAKQREPIRLVKLEGLSVVETAARTGLSVSAVKIGVHRGLKVLAARFSREA